MPKQLEKGSALEGSFCIRLQSSLNSLFNSTKSLDSVLSDMTSWRETLRSMPESSNMRTQLDRIDGRTRVLKSASEPTGNIGMRVLKPLFRHQRQLPAPCTLPVRKLSQGHRHLALVVTKKDLLLPWNFRGIPSANKAPEVTHETLDAQPTISSSRESAHSSQPLTSAALAYSAKTLASPRRPCASRAWTSPPYHPRCADAKSPKNLRASSWCRSR